MLGVAAFIVSKGPNMIRQALGRPQQLGTTSTNRLSTVALSRDGSVLAATGSDEFFGKTLPSSGTVYLWDARTLSPLKSLAPQRWNDGRGSRGWLVRGLSLSPDGKFIGVCGRGGGGYTVYKVATQEILWHSPTRAQSAQFSADGNFVALGTFEMREARTGKLRAHWKATNGSTVEHFALSPDAQTVAWIGKRKLRPLLKNRGKARIPNAQCVEIRRVNDGKILRVLPDSEETESVAFSPDGSKIVSLGLREIDDGSNDGALDGSIIRCHSAAGKLLWKRDFRGSISKGHDVTSYFCDAIFSPDGSSIAVQGNNLRGDDLILVLNASDGSDKQRLETGETPEEEYGTPPALAFSPDGKQLFARGDDAVTVWDLQ